MKVAPIPGELFRFYVESRTRKWIEFRHLVDLEAYNGAGQCSCEHYQFSCEPKLARGRAPSPALRCAHIRAARAYFRSTLLRRMTFDDLYKMLHPKKP